MAAIKPKPKFPLYQSLYNLNEAFETLTHEIEFLRQSKTIAPDPLNLYQSMVEELRAGFNHKIVEKLNQREIEEWGHYGKQRIEQEKRLAQ